MRRGRKGRALAFLVASNVIGLGLLFGVIEGALRILDIPYEPTWTPSENAVAQFDEDLGWSYRPGLSRDVTTENGTRACHFDANGVRVPSPDTELVGDAPSVLFVGGSFTMGHGLSFEESFVGQFGALEEARGLQVVNLGVQGYGTDQALLALRRHLTRFDVRVVVYTFIPAHIRRNGTRDRRLLYPKATFLGTKPTFVLDGDGRPRLAHRPVRYENLRTSYFLDLVRIRLGPEWGGAARRSEKLTRALVREMGETCRSHGVEFVLLNWRWREADFEDFGDLGVDEVDTLDEAPPGWPNMKLPRDEHPNPRASRRAAELLRNHLVTRGVFPEGRSR